MHILFPGFDTWPVVTDQNVLVPEMCTWKHLAKSRLDVSSLPSDGSRKPNGREGGGRGKREGVGQEMGQ